MLALVLFTAMDPFLPPLMGKGPEGAPAPCADVNSDGATDVSDAIHLLSSLFQGGRELACINTISVCGNVNGDVRVDISDAVYLLAWLFLGGPEPSCNEAFREIDGFMFLRTSAQGYAEYLHERTGIEFVFLPGGRFRMGSPTGECERASWEGPLHEVTLSPFLLAKYEVSQAQWKRIMDYNPSRVRGDLLPVEPVSWTESKEFAERTGLDLPTEAQWEYACRAGTETPFTFGETISPDQANYRGDVPYCDGESGTYRETTVPVDSFDPNGFGLYNVHGNVVEWCEDVFSPGFYETPEAVGLDPVAISGSDYRVMRGGCWYDPPDESRSAARYWGLPSGSNILVGFRPAKWLMP